MAPAWASMVTVGRIARPHGNRGWVVVNPETDFGAERFAAGATLYRERDEGAVAMTVAASRPYNRRWAVSFEGLATIDDAETLRDVELRIPEEAVQPLEPGGFYEYDLVGCEVVTTAGDALGRVERVQFGPGVPLLVAGSGDEAVLIPLAEEICREVDLAAKRIVVDPPPGLVELNRRDEKRGAR